MAEEDVKATAETVEQVTTETEPSTVKTKEPAVEQSTEAKADEEIAKDLESQESEDESDADKADDKEVEEITEDEETQPKSAEARKEQLNTEIRDLVSKRNELRQEVAGVNAKVYQPQTAQELIDEGVDPAMARVEALEQRTQIAEFNAHVTDLNANLNIESLQVMSDFPVFNPDAPEYDKTLSERARSVFERAAAIQTDPQTGLIIQANVLPYDIYKAFAETSTSGAQTGSVKGQKAAEKMLAASESTTSSAPKAPKEDNFLKGLTGEA